MPVGKTRLSAPQVSWRPESICPIGPGAPKGVVYVGLPYNCLVLGRYLVIRFGYVPICFWIDIFQLGTWPLRGSEVEAHRTEFVLVIGLMTLLFVPPIGLVYVDCPNITSRVVGAAIGSYYVHEPPSRF